MNWPRARYSRAIGPVRVTKRLPVSLPAIAKSILIKLGAQEGLIEEVCDIVGHHHHPRTDDTTNFKVVYDADLIENLDDKQKENPMDKDKLLEKIDKIFLTPTGRETAEEVLLT